MALSVTSTAKEIVAAIVPVVPTSPIIGACRVHRGVRSNWIFERRAVTPNALSFTLVDLTPPRTDPNGVPFVGVDETITGSLDTLQFTAATFDLAAAAAVTGIEALVTAQLLNLEVPGPRIHIAIGRASVPTSVNAITKRITIAVSVFAASDAGPAGSFVVTPSAVP